MTCFQLIPYQAASPACRLNLPLSLYLVCRLIYLDLPRLSSKLRSLNFTYVVQGRDYWVKVIRTQLPKLRESLPDDDDPGCSRLQRIMPFVEHIRLVGEGHIARVNRLSVWLRRDLGPPSLGSECAFRILEVRPVLWSRSMAARTLQSFLRWLPIPPGAASRLEIRVVRNQESEEETHDLDEIEDWSRRFRDTWAEDASQRLSATQCYLAG